MGTLGEMLTLDQHNEQQRIQREQIARMVNRAGVLCPSCKAEMLFSDGLVLASLPPKRSVHCPNCGRRGYKE